MFVFMLSMKKKRAFKISLIFITCMLSYHFLQYMLVTELYMYKGQKKKKKSAQFITVMTSLTLSVARRFIKDHQIWRKQNIYLCHKKMQLIGQSCFFSSFSFTEFSKVPSKTFITKWEEVWCQDLHVNRLYQSLCGPLSLRLLSPLLRRLRSREQRPC